MSKLLIFDRKISFSLFLQFFYTYLGQINITINITEHFLINLLKHLIQMHQQKSAKLRPSLFTLNIENRSIRKTCSYISNVSQATRDSTIQTINQKEEEKYEQCPWIYLRRAHKNSRKIQVSPRMQIQEIFNIVEKQYSINKEQQVLYIKGNKITFTQSSLSTYTLSTIISLINKQIIHVYHANQFYQQLQQKQTIPINFQYYNSMHNKLYTFQYIIKQNETIKEAIKNNLIQQQKYNNANIKDIVNNLSLFQNGHQIDGNNKFHEQFVGKSSYLIVIINIQQKQQQSTIKEQLCQDQEIVLGELKQQNSPINIFKVFRSNQYQQQNQENQEQDELIPFQKQNSSSNIPETSQKQNQDTFLFINPCTLKPLKPDQQNKRIANNGTESKFTKKHNNNQLISSIQYLNNKNLLPSPNFKKNNKISNLYRSSRSPLSNSTKNKNTVVWQSDSSSQFTKKERIKAITIKKEVGLHKHFSNCQNTYQQQNFHSEYDMKMSISSHSNKSNRSNSSDSSTNKNGGKRFALLQKLNLKNEMKKLFQSETLQIETQVKKLKPPQIVTDDFLDEIEQMQFGDEIEEQQNYPTDIQQKRKEMTMIDLKKPLIMGSLNLNKTKQWSMDMIPTRDNDKKCLNNYDSDSDDDDFDE